MTRTVSLTKEFLDVGKFHAKFGIPTPPEPTLLDDAAYNFRVKFLHEELNEYVDSCHSNDLPIALDSLIDLVYVAAGTAHMMGFTTYEWAKSDVVIDQMLKQFQQNPPAKLPGLLPPDEYNHSLQVLKGELYSFIGAHAEGDKTGCLYALVKLATACIYTAVYIMHHKELWDALWDDVQRANMAKERATSEAQSKRKSTLDVIKPEGWVPPDGKKIIDAFFGSVGENPGPR